MLDAYHAEREDQVQYVEYKQSTVSADKASG